MARIWFVLVSSVYIGIAFFLGGSSFTLGIRFLTDGIWRKEWMIREPAFWLSGVALATVVVLVQLFRIRRSRRRTTASEPALHHTFLSFDVLGQSKMLQILMIFPVSSWAASRLSLQLPQQQRTFVETASFVVVSIALTCLIIWNYRMPAVVKITAPADPSADQEHATELFELITQELDITQPLLWNYTFRNVSDERAGTLATVLSGMGFVVAQPALDEDQPEHVLLSISERRVHTAESFARRLAEVDGFAKSNQVEVCDCTAAFAWRSRT